MGAMNDYIVHFSGVRIGALGLRMHLRSVEVRAEDEASAMDLARDQVRDLYKEYEHIHVYSVHFAEAPKRVVEL